MEFVERARHNIDTYGPLTISRTFKSNDDVPDLANFQVPAYSTAFDADPSVKHHAACDECRKRKLKCSGEMSGCSRCVKQSLVCHYSIQKQMGRPRKRQKVEDPKQTENPSSHQSNHKPSSAMTTVIDPDLSTDMLDEIPFEITHNRPTSEAIEYTTTHNTNSENPQPSQSVSSVSTTDAPRTPDGIVQVPYATDVSQWPDYSDITLPAPVQDNHERSTMDTTMNKSQNSDVGPAYLSNTASIPECVCLDNMYLTLSTISALRAFPVSSHTIDTLQAAHRTASLVVYCPICPQKFQSGTQNVSLSSTLMTVLADHWHRILKLTGEVLRKGFSTSTEFSEPLSPRGDLEWRTFAYSLVQSHVFGKRPIAVSAFVTNEMVNNLINPSNVPPLMEVAEAMLRRQRQGHSLEPKSGEFPEKWTHDLANGHTAGMTLEDLRAFEDGSKNHLCLQLAEHTIRCIRNLDKPVPVIQ